MGQLIINRDIYAGRIISTENEKNMMLIEKEFVMNMVYDDDTFDYWFENVNWDEFPTEEYQYE